MGLTHDARLKRRIFSLLIKQQKRNPPKKSSKNKQGRENNSMTCKNTIKLSATNSTLLIISLRGKSKTLFLLCCTLSQFLHTQIPLPPDFFVRRMQNPSEQSISMGRRRTALHKGQPLLGTAFIQLSLNPQRKIHFSYFRFILGTMVKRS